jgi:predicted cobalt transporter CbtA
MFVPIEHDDNDLEAKNGHNKFLLVVIAGLVVAIMFAVALSYQGH